MLRLQLLLLSSLLLAPSLTACQTFETVPESEIGEAPALDVRGWARVDRGLAIAGQPGLEQYRRLREDGYVTIVNFQTTDEGAIHAATVAEETGLRFVHIPIGADDFGAGQADALAKVVGPGGGRPMLLHCRSGQRAAAVWALYLHRHREMSSDDALNTADSLGLNSGKLRDALIRQMSDSP